MNPIRDFEQIRKIRQDKAKPIADKLYQWLQQRRLQVEKNYPITKALDYCLIPNPRIKVLPKYEQ